MTNSGHLSEPRFVVVTRAPLSDDGKRVIEQEAEGGVEFLVRPEVVADDKRGYLIDRDALFGGLRG